MRTKKQKGFTLTEMIVVIAIIAILAAILIPTVTKYIKNAKFTSDASDADTMTTELTAYCSDNGASIDAAGLHGTEVRTILLNLDFSLVPRSKEWTFVYRDSTNKVEAIYLEDLEKETAANVPAANAYVDPSQVSTDLYLLGLGTSDLEVAVTGLVNCASIEKYNALGDETNGFFKSSNKYRALYAAFMPTKTMYISNGSAFTGATAGNIAKFVYADTTTHISALTSAAKTALGSTKIPLSATIRSVESAAVAYVKQYAGVTYRTISGDDPSVQKLDDQVEQNYKISTAYSQYVTYYQIAATQVTGINSDKTFESHSANIIYVYNSTDKTYIVETKYNSNNKNSYYTLVATSGLSSTDSSYLSATHTDAEKDARIVAGSYYQVYGATYQFGDLVEQSTSQQVSYQVVGYVGTSSSVAVGLTTASATAITSDGAYYLVEKVTTVLNADSFRDTYSSTTDYYANTSYVKFVATESAVTPTDSNYSQYFEKIGDNYVRLSKSTSYTSAVYYTVKASFQKKDNQTTPSTSTDEVIISATNFTDYGATYYLTSKTYYTLNADNKTYSIATYVSGGTYYTLTQVNELYTKTGSNYNVATTITNGDYYYQEEYKYVSSPDFTSGTTYYYLADNKYNSTTSAVSGISIYFVSVYNNSAVTIDGTNNSLVKVTGTLVESKVTVTAWVYRVTISYYNATGLYARTKYEIVQEQNPAQVLSPLALKGLLGSD